MIVGRYVNTDLSQYRQWQHFHDTEPTVAANNKHSLGVVSFDSHDNPKIPSGPYLPEGNEAYAAVGSNIPPKRHRLL